MSTELIALLSLLVVQGFAIAKSIYDGRQKDKEVVRARTWEVEDRQALAAEVARKVDSTAAVTAKRLATSTADIAAELGQQVRTHADAVAADLTAEQRRMAQLMADDASARKATDAAAARARTQLQATQAGIAETQAGIADTLEHDRRNRLAGTLSVTAALQETAKKLDVNTELTDAVKTRLDENTDLTKGVGEAAAAAYDKASERLAALDARVSGLAETVDTTVTRLERLAGARAQALMTEGTAHLADARRITDDLTPTAGPVQVEVVNHPLVVTNEKDTP